MNIWFTLLYQPLVNSLILFYKILGQNLGLAIIGLTLVIRGLLYPLTKPSLEAAKKMQQFAPELEKLKSKHKDNKQALAMAQMELYKKHGFKQLQGKELRNYVRERNKNVTIYKNQIISCDFRFYSLMLKF